MRISICCFFHIFAVFFLLLRPNVVAATVPVPVPVPSSYPLSSQISNHSKNNHSGECDALLRFSNTFIVTKDASSPYCNSNSYARTVSWKEEGGSDCCSWDGVTCHITSSHDVVISGLDLSCIGLQGPLQSDSSLFSLTNLRRLNLAGNDFNGSQIPSRFGVFTKMRYLNLSSSNFVGQVSLDMLSPLSRLISLDLSSAPLSTLLTMQHGADLGRVLRNLTQLKELVLDFMDLSGVDPISFANLSSTLATLSLQFCYLQGTFPIDVFQLPNLRTLDLSMNFNLTGTLDALTNWSGPLVYLGLPETQFHGPIPASIGNLISMEKLDLYSTGFEGTVPATLSKLSRLVHLDLRYNRFNGTVDFEAQQCEGNCSMPRLQNLLLKGCGVTRFPSFLISSTELTHLDLSENYITGQIPEWFWSVPRNKLTSMVLSSNYFTGEIPHNYFCNSTGLDFIDLSNNKFGGPLPIPPPTIEYYMTSTNEFTGGIPHQICNATSILILDLSKNQLTGSIPQCFSSFNASLRILDLGENKFVGQIPEIFNHTIWLLIINLRQNGLRGELPRSLADCEKLKVLDVSRNELKGDFPYWFDKLPKLMVLSLKSNNFHGMVGNSGKADRPFPRLHIFDLSNNRFSGPMPVDYITNFTAMKNNITESSGDGYMPSNAYYKYSIQLVIKGTDTDLVEILVTTIDLSNNSFEGEIPREIGDLKALKGLNFSHNNLTDNIPSSLENLNNLESLDLSSNSLSGTIPTGLALLSWLGTLNLSNNQLVGRIPRSTQFDTFKSNSFGGNPGLCGYPLPKLCENDTEQMPPWTSREEEETYSGSWVERRAVLMGYGCGLAFAISAWYVMTETRRPWWLVGTIERWLLRVVEGKRLNRRTNRPSNNAHRKPS